MEAQLSDKLGNLEYLIIMLIVQSINMYEILQFGPILAMGCIYILNFICLGWIP